MILWLNGPFGVGKSSTAAELLRREPGAQHYDPERLGWVLQRTVGVFRPGDFQDLRAWRRGTIRGVARRARSASTVVVPMTLLAPEYADEILSGLRDRGLEFRHVTLHGSSDALRRRIAADTDDPGAKDWRLGQLSRYEAVASSLAERGPVIDTDALSRDEVATAVQAWLVEQH
jgi:hypothetical protein